MSKCLHSIALPRQLITRIAPLLKKLPVCICQLLLLTAGIFLFGNKPNAQESLAVSKYKTPIAISTKPPLYPQQALYKGQEAWVDLRFIVHPDGSVDNIMVADSSGLETFENSAIRALRQFTFSPAEENGSPLTSEASYMFTFMLEDAGNGASKGFIRQFIKIQSEITEGKLETARLSLDELVYGKRSNLYEDAWTWWLNYQFLEAEGLATDLEKMESLTRAVSLSGRKDLKEQHYLQTEVLLIAMRQLFVLQTRSGQFRNAMKTYEDLSTIKPGKLLAMQTEILEGLRPAQEQMLALLDSNSPLKMSGRLSRHGYIIHPLTHPVFIIEASDNEPIEAVELRCENHFEHYKFLPDAEWRVPGSWSNCNVYLKGTPYASVVMHEYSE